jgi:arylsulfatase
VDLFPTLANWVGGKIPNDRAMDGVDQSDFLMGKSEKSAQESIVIYVDCDPSAEFGQNGRMH